MADYARVIVEHFLSRLGAGSAISSADQALLLGWEAGGVPLDVVLQGIDRAFDERRETPRALAHCRSWIHKAHAGEVARHGGSGQLDPSGSGHAPGPMGRADAGPASGPIGGSGAGPLQSGARPFGHARHGGPPARSGQAARGAGPVAERFARDIDAVRQEDIGARMLAQARTNADQLRHPVARKAYAMVIEAMEEAQRSEEGLDAETLALLDAALVEAALRALPDAEATALRAEVDAALAPQASFLSPRRLQARRTLLLQERLDDTLDGFPGIG